jgi:hypothetical protein
MIMVDVVLQKTHDGEVYRYIMLREVFAAGIVPRDSSITQSRLEEIEDISVDVPLLF